MNEPIIHIAVEEHTNMGDRSLLNWLPITVGPATTLRDLIDIAGKRVSGYVPPSSPDWLRLGDKRIIIQVEGSEP